jgi:hypothetical protein
MRPIIVALLCLSATLSAKALSPTAQAMSSKAQALTPSAQASATPEKAGAYESGGTLYAVGETVHIKVKREQAEQQALKDAIDRMAAELVKLGHGQKRDLVLGVHDAVTKETDLGRFDLGTARLESVYQERWDGAPEGLEAWSVQVKISVRLKSK